MRKIEIVTFVCMDVGVRTKRDSESEIDFEMMMMMMMMMMMIREYAEIGRH